MGMSPHQEFLLAGDRATLTRDELKADNWFLASQVVEYRDHGLSDAYPGQRQVYPTGDATIEALIRASGTCKPA